MSELEDLIAERCQDPGQKFWSQTYSGVAFSLLHPDAEMVRIQDIAHHLSLINRFNGATKIAYNVAEHSVSVSYIVAGQAKEEGRPQHEVDRIAFQGLLHDAAEAYMGDTVRPMKRILPEFFELIEERVNAAISKRFNVELEQLPAEIHHADTVMLMTEKRDLMGPPPRPWKEAQARSAPQPLRKPILIPMSAYEAERVFLDRFHSLYPLRGVDGRVGGKPVV